MIRKLIIPSVITTIMWTACTSVAVKPLPPEIQCDSVISYTTNIVPLLNDQCLGCHSGPTPVGTGDFTTYEGLKVAVDNGTLQRDVVDEHTMPQPGSGYDLTDAERHKFACWIHQGAPNN